MPPVRGSTDTVALRRFAGWPSIFARTASTASRCASGWIVVWICRPSVTSASWSIPSERSSSRTAL